MGVPPHMEVEFLSVDDAAARLPQFRSEGRRGILLTGDIATMARLAERDGALTMVNLGGIHHRVGRTQRLRYVFLTADEERELRALAARGVAITAQDVPGARPVPLQELLGSSENFE